MDRYSTEKKIALWGGGGLTILMVLIWPIAMLENVVQDQGRFLIWTGVSQTWTFLACAYIIVVPLAQEVMEVYGAAMETKQREQQEAVVEVIPFRE